MNLEKLKQAEHIFLMRYPGGFEHPEMIEIGKKHKPEKMTQNAREYFKAENFTFPELIVDNMVKMITQSSMISVFEKPQFRDFAKAISRDERAILAKGLEEILYGNGAVGYKMMIEILLIGKLAKWPIMTICPVYMNPTEEVFVKPTTAKFIINHFELTHLQYNPRPTYEFYIGFKEVIHEMKKHVSSSLTQNNPAFTGFLMMGMPEHNTMI